MITQVTPATIKKMPNQAIPGITSPKLSQANNAAKGGAKLSNNVEN